MRLIPTSLACTAGTDIVCSAHSAVPLFACDYCTQSYGANIYLSHYQRTVYESQPGRTMLQGLNRLLRPSQLGSVVWRGFASTSASDTEDVLLERTSNGHYATITINRPNVHNCLSPTVLTGLEEALHELHEDDTVRAVFLKATGQTFCAGGDLKHMKSTANWTFEQNKEEAFRLSGVFNQLYTFRRPIIAMINGPAYGGGVGIISSCDMAFAVKDAVFALSEVKLGVIPATISPFVVSKIGATASRRYMITAERFDPVEARRIGLINDVVDDVAALEAIEERLKKAMVLCSPDAMMHSKALIGSIEGKKIDDDLRMWTASRLADVRDSRDGQEGMGAFLEKRQPSWTNVEL